MKRRPFTMPGLLGLTLILAGCDYSSKNPKALDESIISGQLPTSPGRPSAPVVRAVASEPESPDVSGVLETERRRIILENFIKLIQTAATNPGGQNFAIATENLNDLFSQGTKPNDYLITPRSRDYLLGKIYELSRQDPEPIVKSFCSEKFTTRDARHIEDCMLYHNVATRVAGEGDDLTKVRRIFDWISRNIVLVPAESLSGSGLRQAQVRPADVLIRGMATEAGGRWSERGWLFMALCRQIGIDVGILTFTPSQSIMAGVGAQAQRPLIPWICAAVVDKQAYLFDQRLGIEIPGPDGTGVATLEEAITNPIVLNRLDLPGQMNYGTTAADLAGSTTKIGVLIDSSPGYLAPRMRLLQGQLRGEYRTNLYRETAEQALNFADAIGRQRIGNVMFWDLPIRVEEALFKSPDFVLATQMTLKFFEGKLPLLYARSAQLRGDLVEATDKYVALRFAEKPVMKDKTPIPADIQRALDFYSTYFLAQAHLERGNRDQAEYLLRKFLEMSPEPGPGRYYYYMLRWGAVTNLARICEAKGDRAGAIALYTQNIQTAQLHGNFIRARNLAWDNPFDEPAAPLTPAPQPPPDELKLETEVKATVR